MKYLDGSAEELFESILGPSWLFCLMTPSVEILDMVEGFHLEGVHLPDQVAPEKLHKVV